MECLPLMPWYLYIIECRDHTLYTGITNNLSRRVSDHNKGNGCKYTRFRRPVKLVHCEEYPTNSEAQKREARVKNLTRTKKLELCQRSQKPEDALCNSLSAIRLDKEPSV